MEVFLLQISKKLIRFRFFPFSTVGRASRTVFVLVLYVHDFGRLYVHVSVWLFC